MRRRHSPDQRRAGQAMMEYILVYVSLLLPLTMALIFTAELLWVWHSVLDFTREGARYAATHCWQPAGDNVVNFMRSNVPLMVDQEQFRAGLAEISVQYFAIDPETGSLAEFSCEGSSCSRECVPETVTVRILNYEFRAFLGYLGLPPVAIPNFQTSLPIESAGCSADDAGCVE